VKEEIHYATLSQTGPRSHGCQEGVNIAIGMQGDARPDQGVDAAWLLPPSTLSHLHSLFNASTFPFHHHSQSVKLVVDI